MERDNLSVLEERDIVQARILCRLAPFTGHQLVLKGGGALRFVFRSPRYSEDLDFDVGPEVSPDLLRERVRQALGDLQVEYSEPKQTETVQRWKLRLFVGLPCKIEFSRRQVPKDIQTTAVDFTPWGEAKRVPLTHLSVAGLLRAKVEAVMSPVRFAPRDAYDLFELVGIARTRGIAVSFPEGVTAEAIVDKLLQIPPRAVRTDLLPLLPRKMWAEFDYDRILEAVWNGLGDLGMAQGDKDHLGKSLGCGASVRHERESSGLGLEAPTRSRAVEHGQDGLVL